MNFSSLGCKFELKFELLQNLKLCSFETNQILLYLNILC
jgi:hypothetical protein